MENPSAASPGGFGSRDAGSFPIWGITQCPLVYGDLLIIASQAPNAGVVAYDKLYRCREMENTQSGQ